MEQEMFRKVMVSIILGLLLILTFFLLKPILMAIILGLIFAFIFSPIYNKLGKYLKSKDLRAALMCVLLLAIILVPVIYLTPAIFEQSIKVYMASQEVDYVTPIKQILPSLSSGEFSSEIGSTIHSFVTNITNSVMNTFNDFIFNFPTLLLKFIIVLFTFYFTLRDGDKLMAYSKSLMPFSKSMEDKIFYSSKQVTLSVLYGQVLLGIVEGLVTALGFFIFGVPNALLLTLLSAIAGVLPIIGTAIVWMPVAVFLLIEGNTFAVLGVTFFGILAWSINNLVKPVFISKRTKLNSSIILIGMVGGLLMFGILGLVLGPLILAYLIIVLDVYRSKNSPNVFLQKPEN